jgi:hypothetical protein
MEREQVDKIHVDLNCDLLSPTSISSLDIVAFGFLCTPFALLPVPADFSGEENK